MTQSPDEECEIDQLAQHAVDNALRTVTREFFDSFAGKLGEKNVEVNYREREESPREVKGEKEKLSDNGGDGLPSFDASPADYTKLCVPTDYSVFGNKIDELTEEQRNRTLSQRGAWPSDDAISYQFDFVEMMRSVEEELEKSEVAGVGSSQFHISCEEGEESGGDESEGMSDDEDDDDDGLSITFQVGPSEINRFPDRIYLEEDLASKPNTEEWVSPTAYSTDSIEPTAPMHSAPAPDKEISGGTLSASVPRPLAVDPTSCPPSYHLPSHRRPLQTHDGHQHPAHRARTGIAPHGGIPQAGQQRLVVMQAMVAAAPGAIPGQEYHQMTPGYPQPQQWVDLRNFQHDTRHSQSNQNITPRPNYRSGQRFGDKFSRTSVNDHRNFPREPFFNNRQSRPRHDSRYQIRSHHPPSPPPFNPGYPPPWQSPSNAMRDPPPFHHAHDRRGDGRWDFPPAHRSQPCHREWGGVYRRQGDHQGQRSDYRQRRPRFNRV